MGGIAAVIGKGLQPSCKYGSVLCNNTLAHALDRMAGTGSRNGFLAADLHPDGSSAYTHGKEGI